MRGLTKVAALLSSAFASAFVLPDSFGIRPAGGVIQYRPLEATVKFAIDDIEANYQPPIFEFHVTGVNKACGESDIEVNGQRLEAEWDGIEAHGRGYLDVYSEHEASWSITCLYDSTPSDGSFSNGNDVVHLLRLRFHETTGHHSPGWTISYKQVGKPAIVRFSPDVVTYSGVNEIAGKWREPSIEFDQDVSPHDHSNEVPAVPTESLWYGKQSLLSSLSAFKGLVQKKIGSAVKKLKLCHKGKTQLAPVKISPLALVPFVPIGNETRSIPAANGLPETDGTAKNEQVSENTKDSSLKIVGEAGEDSTVTFENNDSTSTTPSLSAAETRSLETPEELTAFSPPSTSPSPSLSAPHSALNYKSLKLFGPILILLSCLVWAILRYKDPRWRVDRAARREERRTKRLYKRAARQHKLRTLLWNFRLRFRLVSNEALMWDEKRARVKGQEETLENVMKDDIRALRNAHRVVSNITAAEEGRNGFEYDAESSERRRSVSTLPGYESEGSQPPSYEASRSFEGTTLVGGSSFAPADVDSNPDSSVVSTSPRISRDGTNSDFDEKIEVLSLDHSAVIDSRQVYNHM